MTREPAAAGRFYPGEREELLAELRRCTSGEGNAEEFYGAVVPHAGYMFSGKTAGAVYSRVSLPPAVFILGPNHTGMGARAAVWAGGAWGTPMGELEVDSALAGALIGHSPLLKEDYDAHLYEHSIEVQVPFLQYLGGDIKFVPVCLSDCSLEECREISEALSEAASEHSCGVSFLASSDMSHFEPEKAAAAKDRKAIEAMREMDEEKLYRVVRDENISMCGYIPAVVMLMTVKKLGSEKPEFIEYTTSADATGDSSSVVGYCGMIFR